jgi:serine/threonine protein kinase
MLLQSQNFCREAVAISHLRHDNLLPILGVFIPEGTTSPNCLVMDWVEPGDLYAYCDEMGVENVNPIPVVCFWHSLRDTL